MVNEFGEKLDRNGYAPSIVEWREQEECFVCRVQNTKLDRHEIFGGPYRRKSKRFGLWVHLCHSGCHQGPEGVHQNRELDLSLKKIAQKRAMRKYRWSEEDFIREFGKNYL